MHSLTKAQKHITDTIKLSAAVFVLQMRHRSKTSRKGSENDREAFMAGSDPGSNHANFQMKGENDIRFRMI
jgi:hypothetical protein